MNGMPHESIRLIDCDRRIREAMRPVSPKEVIVCPMLRRVYVVVKDSDRKLAAMLTPAASSKAGRTLISLDEGELSNRIDAAITVFASISGVSEDAAETLTAQGCFTLDDLSQIHLDDLAEMCNVTRAQATAILETANRQR